MIYKISLHINLNSELVQIKLSELTNLAQQFISGLKVVKSSNRERESLQSFNNYSKDYMQSQLSLVKINSLFFPLMILLVGMSTLLSIWAGKNLVDLGYIDIGTITEFIIYVNMLTWPVASIGWISSIIQQAEASQKRINEFNNACKRQGIYKEQILESMRTWNKTNLIVIGDTIVDQYAACEAIGMSAEAPVVVVRELGLRNFIGGAAVVAAIVVVIIGVMVAAVVVAVVIATAIFCN